MNGVNRRFGSSQRLLRKWREAIESTARYEQRHGSEGPYDPSEDAAIDLGGNGLFGASELQMMRAEEVLAHQAGGYVSVQLPTDPAIETGIGGNALAGQATDKRQGAIERELCREVEIGLHAHLAAGRTAGQGTIAIGVAGESLYQRLNGGRFNYLGKYAGVTAGGRG